MADNRKLLPEQLPRVDGDARQQQADDDSQAVLSTSGEARCIGAAVGTSLDGVMPDGALAADESSSLTEEMPQAFGRYQVTGLLGKGAFGVVYRGHDPQLHREVAIKVPRPDWLSSPRITEACQAEAQLLANLRHPGIVQVHDSGHTDDGLFYVVSQFIAGGDLERFIQRRQPTINESAELVARIAEALHHAHKHGLVHRDVKPANILIDDQGQPLVADFGLALTDDAYGDSAGLYGTPAYMSPEQARGEGHRVDGRSDIYSLGVVLYELLAGRRPYRRKEKQELLDEIASGEIRPPRIFNPTIPTELERICLKALARRAADRYTTAFDMAKDLRQYCNASQGRHPSLPLALGGGRGGNVLPGGPLVETVQPKVMPKGLRSFDASDADFFLELLPGPTDRDGLPESIRFWQTRIGSDDDDQAFAVGVLYGPSGCGKSSLVKAGLLPRLARHVHVVYVEAMPDDTEARIVKGLQKATRRARVHEHGASAESEPTRTSLVDAFVELRGGRALAAGERLLIVLDQFEQWLHAHPDPQSSELVRALRQCDGGHVQCLVMVRADFWPGVSRFMRELEIPLVEGHNCALADLFDVPHARRVLALFGRAYGRLPETGPLAAEHEAFLDQAVAALAEDGQVIPVRLALFAEMVRRKSWMPETLTAIGGIAGVGVAFLEDTFSASTAPPPHRFHQPAARAVLKALLPEAGSDIKGHRRSREELLAASGYARPADFAELMRILDGELRLVTPADEEGRMALPGRPEEGPATAEGERQQAEDKTAKTQDLRPKTSSSNPKSYQLTHDYLVPSLRDWLTRKQRETRRGRAELCLAERAAAYHARPDSRNLAGWWEWANILLFTRRKIWTPAEKRVMRAAGSRYILRFAALTAILVVASLHELTIIREKEARRKTEERDSLLRLSNSQLGVLELTPQFWTDVHDTLDRLALLDPEEERQRREQFETRFARELATEIKNVVRDQPGDRERWSTLASKLEERSPELAAQPKAALDDFLRASQVVLDLRAPFRELPRFLQEQVRIAADRGGLSRTQADGAPVALPSDRQDYFDIEMTLAAVD